MKKTFKRILSFVLVISLILTSSVSVLALADEEYLSELRLIYADTYNEAKEILSDTEFKDYKLLNENLNEDTEEIGVWLAYKTTTDIDDAITDLAVMQMGGGYSEGNYQEMLKESLKEYEDMCDEYEKVIEYFIEAYDADYFLAQIAYRQLNLYTIETIGIDKKPSFEGELLGDIFYEGIDSKELATIFMEGNAHVLDNVRSLLAMGVSYNEDEATYLDKVGEMAAEMNDDPTMFEDDDERDYDELAALIAPTIVKLNDMFNELSAYESELNYEDEEFTDEELKYAEHKAMANKTRAVEYLDGKTLYEFCLDYTQDKDDYSSLYPLVAALNDGQEVMTNLACYYNVVRYSMSDYPEEYLEGEIEALEEKYGENPFNVYEGVDRTVFNGTFALTTAASRADAYTEQNTLSDAYFGNVGRSVFTSINITAGAGGIAFMLWGAFEKKAENAAYVALKNKLTAEGAATYDLRLTDAINEAATKPIVGTKFAGNTPDQLMNSLMTKYFPKVNTESMTFYDKFDYFSQKHQNGEVFFGSKRYADTYSSIQDQIGEADKAFATKNSQMIADQARQATTGQLAGSTIIFIVGGAMLLYSAFTLAYTAYSYYHPDYDDIPLSMVDMRETQYGDRYIKYEVVLEAEPNDKKTYSAGDLNAFEAQRWNALYYTKSYEVGKPLLADEFVVSTSNNKPKDNYTPVHRFGEVICYDLNKYNFDYETSIYLSVKQSKNDKAAVTDVPQVVGSVFGSGLWLLIGGVGAIFGVGGTLGTQALLKKKRTAKKES